MRILIATDAWYPQVNGVVRTYERLAEELPKLGAQVSFLVPSQFRSIPCPTYPEIRLALTTPSTIARHIDAAHADFIHIATEGPIGLMTAILPQDEAPVHHELSHALSGIGLGAAAYPGILGLRVSEAVPQ